MNDTCVSGAVRISSIVKHFESLPDPRHERNRRHLLVDVMTLAVCGVVVGCSGPSAIERWAKARRLVETIAGVAQRHSIAGLYSSRSFRAQTRSVSNLFSIVDGEPGERR